MNNQPDCFGIFPKTLVNQITDYIIFSLYSGMEYLVRFCSFWNCNLSISSNHLLIWVRFSKLHFCAEKTLNSILIIDFTWSIFFEVSKRFQNCFILNTKLFTCHLVLKIVLCFLEGVLRLSGATSCNELAKI